MRRFESGCPSSHSHVRQNAGGQYSGEQKSSKNIDFDDWSSVLRLFRPRSSIGHGQTPDRRHRRRINRVHPPIRPCLGMRTPSTSAGNAVKNFPGTKSTRLPTRFRPPLPHRGVLSECRIDRRGKGAEHWETPCGYPSRRCPPGWGVCTSQSQPATATRPPETGLAALTPLRRHSGHEISRQHPA